MKKKRILLAGATGYLGGYVAHTLLDSGYDTRLVVRNPEKVKAPLDGFDIRKAAVTQPSSLSGLMDGIHTAITTVGITRQRDGLTYMDVDYQANLNLLREAQASGVRKFIYVSVLNGELIRHLKIGEAKEKMVDAIKASGMDYCIIRPNGFFSDLEEILNMAIKGRVYLFGDGNLRLNPIHGEDLAKVLVGAVESNELEIEVGGPEILSQNDIARLAFEAVGKRPRIVHLPDWMRRFALWAVRKFASPQNTGPIEFFLTTLAMEMVAPSTGKRRLQDFFRKRGALHLPKSV